MLSVAPPAGNGTTKRIGLLGNVLWANRAGGTGVDLSKEANGIYFVQITDSNKSIINKRIIKQ